MYNRFNFALIYSSLLSLYENIGLLIHKENIKLVLSEIVDNLWTNQIEYTDLSLFQNNSYSLHETLNKRIETKNFSLTTRLPKKTFDLSTLSDFSFTKGPGTFNKQTKTAKLEISPGPSDYNINLDKIKARSPSIITPKSKKNSSKLSDTPGPGSYSPMFHFRSR